ncbi:hypothetical protein N9Z70_04295 [Mariniblastus sp.]|nr:hypothetical protein [Mariniblastus sp.]
MKLHLIDSFSGYQCRWVDLGLKRLANTPINPPVAAKAKRKTAAPMMVTEGYFPNPDDATYPIANAQPPTANIIVVRIGYLL